MLDFGDLAEHLLVIGGQVVALEDRARGRSGNLSVALETGPVIGRGFSLDIDLLYDGDAEWQDERIPLVLRERGYVRSSGARWTKTVQGVLVAVDLLTAPGVDPADLPTEMTTAAGGGIAARRAPQRISLSAGGWSGEIPIPDATSFLALKLAARERKETRTKDGFDLFAYVHLVGAHTIDRPLRSSADGMQVRQGLWRMFGSETSQGIADVLQYASTLEPTDRGLVSRAAIDLFSIFGPENAEGTSRS